MSPPDAKRPGRAPRSLTEHLDNPSSTAHPSRNLRLPPGLRSILDELDERIGTLEARPCVAACPACCRGCSPEAVREYHAHVGHVDGIEVLR